MKPTTVFSSGSSRPPSMSSESSLLSGPSESSAEISSRPDGVSISSGGATTGSSGVPVTGSDMSLKASSSMSRSSPATAGSSPVSTAISSPKSVEGSSPSESSVRLSSTTSLLTGGSGKPMTPPTRSIRTFASTGFATYSSARALSLPCAAKPSGLPMMTMGTVFSSSSFFSLPQMR
ncbi:hypothetical protein [Corallococcus interemptor]|uniref:hypothetical protein n=1 Tax=Corallococcus interemptor TaxID=2316720 RepID=UPI002680C963|nr:hypothetical protein [Corallococcus interemptor]